MTPWRVNWETSTDVITPPSPSPQALDQRRRAGGLPAVLARTRDPCDGNGVLVESVREGLAIFLQLEPSVLTAIPNRFQALNNDPHSTGIEAMQSWPEDVTALEARH